LLLWQLEGCMEHDIGLEQQDIARLELREVKPKAGK
jgi:hypothetical protein